jgi:transposase
MTKGNTTLKWVVGLDLGDRFSQACVLDRATGALMREERVSTTPTGLSRFLKSLERSRVVVEVGTHSPWVSREIETAGHEVVVAKAGRLPVIFRDHRKSDRRDAEYLARLGRMDVKMLEPLKHRSEGVQRDLAALRSRDALLAARTLLINHCRGLVKSFGQRFAACDADSFAKKAEAQIPAPLLEALSPVVATIQQLTEQIRAYNRGLERTIKASYPAAQQLRQVGSVGPVTALRYVLTIEDPWRFARPRNVAAYVGLVPRRHASGERDPQLGITRAGDRKLRTLLVECAQHMLGPFGADSALRRFGERLMERGGPRAKRRAVVAVARKLSVLLLVLWRTGQTYDPMHNTA